MRKSSLMLGNLATEPVRRLLETLRKEDRGVTAVEYGLMVALIAVVIIVAVLFLGNNLKDLFNSVGSTIANP